MGFMSHSKFPLPANRTWPLCLLPATQWVARTFCFSHIRPTLSSDTTLSISCPVSPSTVTTAKNSSALPALQPVCPLGQSGATCQPEHRLKTQAPDTDGQSSLPHVFAISVTARFGVAGSQQKTSSSLPHMCMLSRLPGPVLHRHKEQSLRSFLGLKRT